MSKPDTEYLEICRRKHISLSVTNVLIIWYKYVSSGSQELKQKTHKILELGSYKVNVRFGLNHHSINKQTNHHIMKSMQYIFAEKDWR